MEIIHTSTILWLHSLKINSSCESSDWSRSCMPRLRQCILQYDVRIVRGASYAKLQYTRSLRGPYYSVVHFKSFPTHSRHIAVILVWPLFLQGGMNRRHSCEARPHTRYDRELVFTTSEVAEKAECNKLTSVHHRYSQKLVTLWKHLRPSNSSRSETNCDAPDG